jgi:hypothetical protein
MQAGLGNICAEGGLACLVLLGFVDWHIPCLYQKGGRVCREDVFLCNRLRKN